MDSIYLLDIFGTFVFAITGALKAFKHKLDLIGVLILALLTAVGGGTMREILLGNVPPFWMRNGTYFFVVLVAGLIAFIFPTETEKRQRFFYFFDAIGLGVFTAVGCLAAQKVGLEHFGIVFCATLTAVGGGVLRDISVREIPLVFHKEIYASASIIGSIVFLVTGDFAVVASIITTIIIRLLAMHYSWNLPTARTQQQRMP
jgi:uncharacterized membrane protein YeiH